MTIDAFRKRLIVWVETDWKLEALAVGSDWKREAEKLHREKGETLDIVSLKHSCPWLLVLNNVQEFLF